MTPHKHKPEDNVDSWLMSYADMITLLLAFFIIFVATSEPKQDKFAAATRGMKERFGMLSMESPFDDTYRNVVGVVANHHDDTNIAIVKTSRGMEVDLAALHFFAPGSAEIPPEQLPTLKDIAASLKQGALVAYAIHVESHTSDTAPGAGFATNWDLAAARATAVAKLLESEGIPPAQIEATSYGASRPLVPNLDAQGNPIPENQAKNQRVVIRVEKEK